MRSRASLTRRTCTLLRRITAHAQWASLLASSCALSIFSADSYAGARSVARANARARAAHLVLPQSSRVNIFIGAQITQTPRYARSALITSPLKRSRCRFLLGSSASPQALQTLARAITARAHEYHRNVLSTWTSIHASSSDLVSCGRDAAALL